MKNLRLWLLDADVIIELLNLGVFEKLANVCEVHISKTVIGEVKHYRQDGVKTEIDFRAKYVTSELVTERDASLESLSKVSKEIPSNYRIHDGELEALAVLLEDTELTFCCIDASAIRVLPFLDLSERSISMENLLKHSGLTVTLTEDGHTEEYYQSNLKFGKEQKMYSF